MSRLPVLCSACLAFALLVSASPAHAQLGTLTYGVKAGLVAPGCVYIDDSFCFDADANLGLGGFLDYALAERLSGGLFVDVHSVSVEGSDTETMIDLGFMLKAFIPVSGDAVALRPGFGLGYGRVTVEGEDVEFLTLRAPLEVLYVGGGGITWGGELALYYGPTGGSDESDVTFGPGFMLRGLIVF